MISSVRGTLLLLLLRSASVTGAQTTPDVPSIQVRTDSQIATATTPSRSKHPKPPKVTVEKVIVRVDLKSFGAPKVPYDVQCFIIVRSDLDGSKYICDAQRKTSSAKFDTVLFQAGPMTGDSKWISIPPRQTKTSGEIVTSSPVVTKRVKGTKYHGWVVRVVSNEVAVRHESNQPELAIAAEKTPAAFDMAVANAKE